MFCKKGVLKNSAKFIGKCLCQRAKNCRPQAKVFSCKFCEFFKNIFFITPPVAAFLVSQSSQTYLSLKGILREVFWKVLDLKISKKLSAKRLWWTPCFVNFFVQERISAETPTLFGATASKNTICWSTKTF